MMDVNKKQENLMRHLGELLDHDLGYLYGEHESGPNGEKKEFLNSGKRFLKQLGKDLGLTEMKTAMNPSGIAVSGDVTLMGMWNDSNGIYISMSQPMLMDWCLLYREIKHMKDYSGGFNRYLNCAFLKRSSYLELKQKFLNLNINKEDAYGVPA